MFLLSPRVSRTSVSSATDVARKHAFFWPIATHKVPFSETHHCCCCCCRGGSAQTLHFLNHQSTGDPRQLVYHPAVKTPSGRRRQRAREIEKRSVMTERALEWTLLPLILLFPPVCHVFSTPLEEFKKKKVFSSVTDSLS